MRSLFLATFLLLALLKSVFFFFPFLCYSMIWCSPGNNRYNMESFVVKDGKMVIGSVGGVHLLLDLDLELNPWNNLSGNTPGIINL